MQLYCQNTSRGLVPLYDDDFDKKRTLKVGETYRVEVRKPRNYRFHKKYFALINCAWEYQSEKRRWFFRNSIELFRKTVEISAGHCEQVYSISKKEWLEIPKSISFDKMDEETFSTLYERVKDVLYDVFLKDVNKEDFEKNLINF